jgi:hypothetical protein
VYSSPLVYNNLPGSSFTNTIVNPELSPLSRTNYEVGADIKLLKNKINLDVTYFKYIDGPQIFSKPISEATGYTSQLVNAVKTHRSGFEVSVSGTPVKTKGGFSWDVLANWSTYKEVLAELPAGTDAINRFYKVGDRLDNYYDSAMAHDSEGNIIHDASGRPIVIVQFDGRVGGVITNYVQRQTFRGGRHLESTEGAMGIARDLDWQNQKAGKFDQPQVNGNYVGEGVSLVKGTIKYDQDGNITNMNELEFTKNTTKTFLQDYISRKYSTSEANLMSKSFAKLREVTLTYNFPIRLFNQSTWIKGASISFVGRNLLYFAEKKDIDLDNYIGTNYSGLQSPTTKRYGVNINVKF